MNFEQAENAIEPHINAIGVYARDRSDKTDIERLTNVGIHILSIRDVLDTYSVDEGRDTCFSPLPCAHYIRVAHADLVALNLDMAPGIGLRQEMGGLVARVELRQVVMDINNLASAYCDSSKPLNEGMASVFCDHLDLVCGYAIAADDHRPVMSKIVLNDIDVVTRAVGTMLEFQSALSDLFPKAQIHENIQHILSFTNPLINLSKDMQNMARSVDMG